MTAGLGTGRVMASPGRYSSRPHGTLWVVAFRILVFSVLYFPVFLITIFRVRAILAAGRQRKARGVPSSDPTR